MSDETIGVIIGRFQVPELSKAHRFMLDVVSFKHTKVIVLIGDNPGQPSSHFRNPTGRRRARGY